MNHKALRTVLPLLTSTLLGLSACETTPVYNDELEHARAEVRTLAQDPDAQHAAAEQLRAAQDEVAQADSALAARRAAEEVSYLAYLAQRQAEIGLARLDEYRAREQLTEATAERDRILLAARSREARRAQEAARTQAQEAAAARDEAQQAKEQAEDAQARAQQAQQQLEELNAKQTARGLEVTLASDLLFDTNTSTVKPGGELALTRLATFMTQNPRTHIIVEGHTDGRGSEDYNQALSERRAQAVAQTLEARGLSAERIRPTGRGKDFPVASNLTPEGRQQNRRVAIILSDMSGRFAEGASQGPVSR